MTSMIPKTEKVLEWICSSNNQPNGRSNQKIYFKKLLGPETNHGHTKVGVTIAWHGQKRKAISSAFNLIPSWNVAIKESDVCIFKYAYVHICTYLIHPK